MLTFLLFLYLYVVMCCYYLHITVQLRLVLNALFTEAIDKVWATQQRHLGCFQDPPLMPMYRVSHSTKINGVDVPYYKCVRGSNSLEGFHKFLPHMIPGINSSIFF